MASESKAFLRQIFPKHGEAEDAEIDVVAVHGLDPLGKPGHAYHTWTSKPKNNKDPESEKLWLKDFLPNHPRMPKLRVLLYGYNSSAAFRASTIGVAGAANNLLDQLRYKRLDHENRPIVFVCHSLGGIVVKQALVEAHNADEIYGGILKATKGVAFFGTPHRGGHGAKLGDSIVRVIKAFTGDVRNDILESLRTDSFLSNHLQVNFARRAKNMRVVSFMETQAISDNPILKHYGLVVPRNSSCLGWSEPAEVQVLMEATHTSICKFLSEDDEQYLRVADHMRELLTWATQPAVPVPSVRIEETDLGPPPPYTFSNTSDSASSLKADRRSRSDSDSSLEDDSSDEEEGQSGWFGRVLSPFRPLSPAPVRRPEKSWIDENSTPETTSVWPIVMLPYPKNPSYINRLDIWHKILSAMNQGVPIVLNGVGGSGKTQTAIYLTHWFRERNPDASIMWVHAVSSETYFTGMQLIASRIGIQSSDNRHVRLTALKDFLEHPKSGRWIIIFDSADDATVYDAMSEFLPRCIHGQVIITSRRKLLTTSLTAPEFVFGLSALTPDEAVELVQARLHPGLLANVNPADMHRLLKSLDYLPLAIAQAIAYMNKNSVSVAFYVTKISNDTLLSEQLSHNHISDDYNSGVSAPVYSTWKTSFERLQNEAPQAVKLLSYFSFLEVKTIPIDLVRELGFDILDVDKAIVLLEEYSFATLSEDRTRLSLHRLLHVVTQRWLEETHQIAESRQHVLTTLSEKFPDAALSKQWPKCEAWLDHGLKILRVVEEENGEKMIESPTLTKVVSITHSNSQENIHLILQLKMKIGYYYNQMGQYTLSREYLEEVVESSRQNFGTMDDLTLSAQEKLIHTLRYINHTTRASSNARDLKRARKAKLGRKHRDTLESYRIYSLTYQDAGKWHDALVAGDRALSGFKEIYKDDLTHRDVLRSYRITAVNCEALGQYERAEKLLREAIQGWETRNEGGFADAASCWNILSQVQVSMGNCLEGEASARKGYEVRKSIMKPNHPDVLKSYYSVGCALQGRKQWESAQEVFESILVAAQLRPEVGKTHRYSYTLQHSLGTLQEEWADEDDSLMGVGAGKERLFKARAILGDVLIGRAATLGEGHLDTLDTKSRLGSVNGKLGYTDDCEKMCQEVLKVVSSKPYRRLGVASALIAWTCLDSLRRCALDRAVQLTDFPGMEKQLQEQRKVASGYAKAIFEGSEKMLGPKHPHTVTAVMNYIEALDLAGDDKTAQKIRQKSRFSEP